MNPTDYAIDFYAWTQQQAELLRNKDINYLDWENIAEEIEGMGRSEKRQLKNRLKVLIMHLLKWQYQPNLRSRSWQLTIKEQRLQLEELLLENPSLKSSLEDIKEKTYPLAIIAAEKETGLSIFPEVCPYNIQDILSSEFLPS